MARSVSRGTRTASAATGRRWRNQEAASLSATSPATRWTGRFFRQFFTKTARAAASSGVWPTSRRTSGSRATIWQRPGQRTEESPARMASGEMFQPGRRMRRVERAATARAALRSWKSPWRGRTKGFQGPSSGVSTASFCPVPARAVRRMERVRSATTRGQRRSAAMAARVRKTGSGWALRTRGRPGLAMPPFSAAIWSRVLPRMAVCSRPMSVTTERRGRTTFVASRRPPRPVSTTAMSTRWRRNQAKAAAVVISKKVAGRWPGAADWRESAATASARRAWRGASGMGLPETRMRSLKRRRWGLV